jgi:hypothetical protein
MRDVPDLIFYAKPGCHLCEQARGMVDDLLRVRAAVGLPVPLVEERDITSDQSWERAFFDKIPVVDLGGRREELVISPARLRRLLADVLDAPAAWPAPTPGG